MVNLNNEKVLGTQLYYEKKVLKEEGDEVLSKVIESVSDEEAKEILKGTTLPQDWFPLKAHVSFLRAVYDVLGEDKLKDISRKVLELQSKGFYGMVMELESPEKLAQQANDIWQKQFSPGSITAEYDSENRSYKVTLKDFETEEVHVKGIYYWIERLLESLEKQEVKSGSYEMLDEKTTDFEYNFK